MKVLMISMDRKIFEKGSAVRARMLEYGALFDELSIIVFAGKNTHDEKIAENVSVYSTQSSSRFSYMRDAFRWGVKILEGKDGYVITTQDPFETGLVGKKLARKYRIPLQVQVHTDFLSPYFTRGSLLNYVRLIVAKRVIPFAHALRVVREGIKQSIIECYKISPEKITVLPIIQQNTSAVISAIDLKKKYPAFDTITLMASRFTREKDIQTALNAFNIVLKKKPRAGLIIVGEGEEEQSIRKNITALGIENSVIIEPWRSHLASYYASCDVFLLTSLFEGYGLTLVEASLQGKAIVTTRVGIAQDILKDGESACVCDAKDTKCLASGIFSLLDDPSLREKYGRNAKRAVEEKLITKEAYLEAFKENLEALVV